MTGLRLLVVLLTSVCWISGHPVLAFGFLPPSSRTALHYQIHRDHGVNGASKGGRAEVEADNSCLLCKSHISSIRCQNVGSMINYLNQSEAHDNDEIEIVLGPSLV